MVHKAFGELASMTLRALRIEMVGRFGASDVEQSSTRFWCYHCVFTPQIKGEAEDHVRRTGHRIGAHFEMERTI